MQKRLPGSVLFRTINHQPSTINRQAQTLAVASFNSIRARLEYQAIGLLRSGKAQVEVERAILGSEPPSAVLADGLDLSRAFPSSSPRGVPTREAGLTALLKFLWVDSLKWGLNC